MKKWKLPIQSCLTTIGRLCVLFSISISAQPVNPLELKTGLWEGVNSKLWQYHQLEINADGHHRFFKANIVTAFKKVKVLSFSNDQIVCTRSECTINIIEKNEDITRLIISPYLENSFMALEINADAHGQPIFTQTYQLDKNKEQSTVADFIKNYRNRLESLSEIQGEGVYGFWLGVLTMDDKPELISLEAYPYKESHLTRFVNGRNFVIKTSFVPEKIKIEQDVIYIETEHPTFANKLIINQLSGSQLSGYLYSVHKGQALETGNFLLMRVR